MSSLIHGATRGYDKTPEYTAWSGMKDRCYRPGNKRYVLYGGRGIRVCERWLHSFAAFIEDMGPRPGPGYSIDRINGNGDYEPGNCRWATPKMQGNNTSRNHVLEARGERHTISEWSDMSGVPASHIWARVATLGWDPERAIFTPRISRAEGMRMNQRKRWAK